MNQEGLGSFRLDFSWFPPGDGLGLEPASPEANERRLVKSKPLQRMEKGDVLGRQPTMATKLDHHSCTMQRTGGQPSTSSDLLMQTSDSVL